jgi:hypothetical protein
VAYLPLDICQEYYSGKKKKEIMLLAGEWMELENMLRKVSQAQKVKGHVFLLIYRS